MEKKSYTNDGSEIDVPIKEELLREISHYIESFDDSLKGEVKEKLISFIENLS